MVNPNETLKPSTLTENLHHDILLEIFSRIPTKTVGKYRCLSKEWNTQLSTKRFIDTHLALLKARQKLDEKLVFIHQRHIRILTLEKIIKRVDKPEFLPMKTIRKIDMGKEWSLLFGSCNGLVLILDYSYENMFVLNPVTRKRVRIPYPGEAFPGQNCIRKFGFGYDSSSDDYKVVRVSEHSVKDEHGRRYVFDVYSLRTRVWRRVDNAKGTFDDQEIVAGPVLSSMPFVNGALHWAVRNSDSSRYYIHAFDLATETFRQLQFPKQKEVENEYLKHLMVLKGCLSITVRGSNTDNVYDDLWMMTEYGVVDSCVRFSFDPYENGMPVGFVEEKELLCVHLDDGNYWWLWDMREEEVRIITEGPVTIMSAELCRALVESLVSPEQGN